MNVDLARPVEGGQMDMMQQLFDQFLRERIAGQTPIAKPTITVAEVIAIYSDARQEKHRPGGWKSIQTRLRSVVRSWGSIPVIDLTHDHADGYIRERIASGVARSTAAQELQTLVTAVNVAVKRRKFPYNPLAGYEFDVKKSERDRIYTMAEIDALADGARRGGVMEVHAFILVMKRTGIRPLELLQTEWDNVDLETGAVWVPDDVAKTGVGRACAVWPEALAALQELPRVNGYLFASPRRKADHASYATINRQWHKAVDVSGIALNEDGSRPELYSLRHTLATRLALEEGYETAQLMAAMGWTNPLQARAYVRPGMRQAIESAAKLQAKEQARGKL